MPAAVVLDLVLPEMDGWDVLVALKGDPEVADMPVIIVSMLDDRGKGWRSGRTSIWSSRSGVTMCTLRSAARMPAASGGLVLVIDDDPLVVRLAEERSRTRGMTC